MGLDAPLVVLRGLKMSPWKPSSGTYTAKHVLALGPREPRIYYSSR